MYGSEEAGRSGGARDTRFLRDELDELEHQGAQLQRELKDKERQLLEERQISDRVRCWFIKVMASSSTSSYSHFYVGSMYEDIRLHVLVARLYTSSADSLFSMISSFTLSNHLGLPPFLLPCTFISIALLSR